MRNILINNLISILINYSGPAYYLPYPNKPKYGGEFAMNRMLWCESLIELYKAESIDC